jgi:tRNA nucleotidyltransferase (CCA-adding enzyme)
MTAEDLLRYAPILTQVIPELAPAIGFDQHSPHHAYDVYTHTAHVVGAVSKDIALRWAALLHDIGKVSTFTLDENGRGHFYGHAQESARMADEILRRLKAPTALREQVVLLIGQHMTILEPDKKILRRRLGAWGEETVRHLLALQNADFYNKGVQEEGSLSPV